MHASSKLLNWLLASTLLTYVAVVALGYYMPLQNDEVSELILHSRAWMDGKISITLLPQCGKTAFSEAIPFIWYLPAYINYLTNAQIENPAWIRIAGIFQFAVWLGLWLAIAIRLFAIPPKYWWAALALLLALLGFDAMPLALLVNRPEQLLLIGTGSCMALALYAEPLGKNIILRMLATFWLIFIVTDVHAVHPKSVAMLPMECAMGAIFLYRSWQSRIMALVGIALMGWVGIESYNYYIYRMACPDVPEVTQFFSGVYLPLPMLWQSPLTFLTQAFLGVLSSLFSNFYLEMYFHLQSVVWLPLSLHPLNGFLHLVVTLLDAEGWFIHVFPFIFSIWFFYRYTRLHFSKDLPPQNTQYNMIWLGLGTLLINMGAISVFLEEGIYYSATLMIPLALLAGLLAFGLKYSQGRQMPNYPKLLLVVVASAILNQLVLLERYHDLIASPEKYDALAINHNAFSPTQGYAGTKKDMEALAAQCHIATDHSTSHLAVDDTTYTFFRNTHQPIFFPDSSWVCCHNGDSNPLSRGAPWFNLKAYLKLLRSYGSDGVIARCSLYPESLRALSTKRSGLCCIPKSVIEKDQ